MRRTTAVLVLATIGFAQAGEPVDYLREVKPILAGRCFACHGALKQEASLRLDAAAFLRSGGDSGPAIQPGKSGESLIIQRVTDKDESVRMPPHDVATALAPAQIAILARWIDEGAKSPADEAPETDPKDHWAFRKIIRPSLPTSNDRTIENSVDAFLADKRTKSRIVLQPRAPASVLLRRVHLDLVGLPPTRDELHEFAADRRPDAFERVVDRLLASPAYGERWARHWMDIWRYSDWWGLGDDLRNSQKHIWHWRDWIVESLNADAGYDEMLREMLAADELYPNDLERLRASGYLARQYFKFNRTTWLDDAIEHTSKAFLGLTMNCAKCHDHKFDPIAQTDYYRFRAYFEPYQLRTDQVPGEVDLQKDGIPRAFDCNLDAPTYLFVRGDERRPQKDLRLSPALPAILTAVAGEPTIMPVTLPPESHHPGLRPFVLADHLQQAETRLAEAKKSQSAAHEALAAVKKAAAAPSSLLVHTVFQSEQPELWNVGPGDWKYDGGALHQSQVGETSARLQAKFDAPADFEATFRFTIQGGHRWKSVGMSFDVADGHDVFVYLSAVEGGSKLQVGYTKDGKAAYPVEGQMNRPVTVGKPLEFTVQVRGPLINVFTDGKLQLAWRLPFERKPGRLELWTFDAKADFHRFELASLPPATPRLAGVPTPLVAISLEQALAAAVLADRKFALAEAEPDLLRALVAADHAKASNQPNADAAGLARAAANAQRAQSLRKAEVELAAVELERLTSEARNLKEPEKRLTAAREAVTKARAALDSKDESYAGLMGSQKSPESNLEDEASRTKPYPTTSTGRRSALAAWLTDPRNPLTPRVAVNHVWARHFGRPIVETVFDFGRKGSQPTHPELLDDLATDFIEHGWEMKHLHRMLVTSRIYQTTSSEADASEGNKAADPENKLYWRMNPVRMESQVMRDASLALAGKLDLQIGGPPVPLSEQDTSRRRSMYFVHSHNDQHRFLSVFDDASVLQCYRRSESIVPQQALALSNSKLSFDSASAIASHFDPTASDAAFVHQTFEAILATPPTPEEESACLAALKEFRSLLAQESEDVATRKARVGVVHALLNHNDFITIR